MLDRFDTFIQLISLLLSEMPQYFSFDPFHAKLKIPHVTAEVGLG